ncbi:MAG: aldose epimerase family protein [Lachnospiraceae bacterium]
MSIEKVEFGTTGQGDTIHLFRIKNSSGAYIEVINLGAILKSIVLYDREGELRDVVLGYDTVAEYEQNPCYFGATIGRNGNRIAGAKFSIDGQSYTLEANQAGNNLHSGPNGFEKQIWSIHSIDEAENRVTFAYLSADGENGFPGELDCLVSYAFSEENELIIQYTAHTTKTTIVNLTNHSYFNLAGAASGTSVLTHKMQIDADCFVPVADEGAIPTGEIRSVEQTPFDFITAKTIGEDLGSQDAQLRYTGGYDHTMAINEYEADMIRPFAQVSAAESGIGMEVSTDLPGVQFYTGNHITDMTGKGGAPYTKHSGFCLETQFFPNAVNEPAFASPQLQPGEEYNSVTIYQFFSDVKR